ncbi:MAG: DMT family transporter [Desulfovibrio sp.]|jgi:drug/metabolite transporter (DMT)-like permease|nr:DMT family transporter [Desulfovibrio sp.]
MQISRRKALLLFSVVILAWGFNWPVVKQLVMEMPPIWSAALRCSIGAAAVLIIQCATGHFVIPRRQDIYIVLVIGIINMAIGPALMALGLQFIPAGRSAVLGYTTPLWVAPGAWFFLREKQPPRRILGIIIGICGVAVLCNPLAIDFEDDEVMLGHALLLLNALTWAVAILCIRAHVWLSTPFQLLFWQTCLSSVLLIALALAVEGMPAFTPSPSLILLLAYCGIPATAVAYWAMTVINASLPATVTSLGVLAAPVVGILSSNVILGESADQSLIIATAMIIGGIAIGAIPEKKTASPGL